MTKKARSKSKPWTLDELSTEDRPRGSKSELKAALALLEPFKFRTSAEAEAERASHKLRHPVGRAFWWLSAEEAEIQIKDLAQIFNWQARIEQNAPRIASVSKQLHDLEQTAFTLRQDLLNLDDYARAALETAGSMLALPYGRPKGQAEMLYAKCGGISLPPSSGSARDANSPPLWTDILQALSQYAGLTKGNFVKAWAGPNPDRPDAGGNTNLFSRVRGSAKWQLAVLAWNLFESCRPIEASATAGGSFHRFAAAIYQFATGKSAEGKGVGLVGHVKHICRVKKDLNKVLKGLKEIDVQLAQLELRVRAQRSGPSVKQTEKRKRLEVQQVRFGVIQRDLLFEINTGARPKAPKAKYRR